MVICTTVNNLRNWPLNSKTNFIILKIDIANYYNLNIQFTLYMKKFHIEINFWISGKQPTTKYHEMTPTDDVWFEQSREHCGTKIQM